MSMKEIIDRLSTEARRLRVGQKLPERGAIPDELVMAVHADFVFMLEQPGVTIDLIAKAMGEGFSRGSLSRFKNITDPADYNGDVERVVRGEDQRGGDG